MALDTAAVARPNSSVGDLPVLDEKQAGHLRHYHNLMAQLDGDWSHMQGDDPDNVSDESGFRYQLGYMSYAMAVAHRNRLPAAPAVFKRDFDRAIQKMLRRECWGYWFGMSQSGPHYDPELTEPRKPWWDPVVKENIMYSGHLSAMCALYGYLFDDDKYDLMGSIHFEPGALQPGSKTGVEYNLKSLNDAIYWQLVETGFVGVACQPNLIFAICNQFPIWGFHFDDLRKGTTVAREFAQNHEAAWKQRGGYIPGRPMPFMVRQRQDVVWDADWSGGYFLTNSWNPDYFASVAGLAKQVLLARDDRGRLVPRPVSQGGKARRAIVKGEAPPPLDIGLEERAGATAMTAGYLAITLSEWGDPDFAEYMERIDACMSPVWRDGGYSYPRNDMRWDEDGNFRGVCPHSGNVTYGWARLNVKDGLKRLYNEPWGREHFAAPNLAEISEGVDVLRAMHLPEQNRLVLTLKPMHGTDRANARLAVANARRPGLGWTLRIGDEAVASGGPDTVDAAPKAEVAWRDGALVIEERVEGPTDFVLDWASR